MRGELLYVYKPLRSRIMWAIVYVVLLAGTVFGFWLLGSQIQTHNIPVGEVALSVPHSRYAVGESVTFTLTNNFNSPIYVLNHCPNEPLGVFRQDDSGKWVRLHDQASPDQCTVENRQVSVAPGQSISGSFAAWPHLFAQPGKYRVVALVEYYNALPYQDFEITAKVDPLPPPTPSTPPATSAAPSAPRTTSPQGRQSKTITTAGGSIVVQYDSSNVYIVSVNPASGWSYQGGGSGQSAQVTFINGESAIQVSVAIQNGQFVQQIQQDD